MLDDEIEIDDLKDASNGKTSSSTSAGTRQRPKRRGLPQRSKSDHGGALVRAASLRNVGRPTARGTRNKGVAGKQQDPQKNNTIGSRSDHSSDSWFSFDEEPEEEQALQDWSVPSRPLTGSAANSRHSIMSSHSNSRHSFASHTSSDDAELSGDSFHGDEEGADSGSRAARNRRGALQRTPSMRRKAAGRRRDVQRGVSRNHSSDLPGGLGGRKPPARTRSDALTSVRRETMKAMYRSQAEAASQNQASGAANHRRAALGLSSGHQRRGSSRDLGASFGDLPASSSHDASFANLGLDAETSDAIPKGSESGGGRRSRLERAKSGLEVGALGGGLGRPPARSRSDDSLPGAPPASSEDDKTPRKTDRKWLERRANKQSEILSIAHDVRDRFEEDRERHEMEEQMGNKNFAPDELGGQGEAGDDDDQPMAMRTKKTALQQLKKVVNKTGAGARSLGKGTVNAINDPKLAAKRFGHLSKDVGKATIKTALDPKKMAKGAKSVTVSFDRNGH